MIAPSLTVAEAEADPFDLMFQAIDKLAELFGEATLADDCDTLLAALDADAGLGGVG